MVRDAACRASRRDGRRCAATVVLPSGYCPMHDPERGAEVAASRARGGRNKAGAVRAARLVPATLRPVLATLLAALDEVRGAEGEPAITPAQANAMASLAGAIVRVYQVGVLEERVAALEAGQAEREATTA
jgi:hypothetical protein